MKSGVGEFFYKNKAEKERKKIRQRKYEKERNIANNVQ